MEASITLRSDCRLTLIADGSGDYVARTPNGQLYRVPSTAYDILQQLDRQDSRDTACKKLAARYPDIDASSLYNGLARAYRPLLLSSTNDGGIIPQTSSGSPAQRLFAVERTVFSANFVGRFARPLAYCFNTSAVAVCCISIAWTHYLVYHVWLHSRRPAHPIDSSLALVLCLISIIFHEFGHAAALIKSGAQPGRIGFGFYLLAPVFYADVSSAWTLGQSDRLRVDLGGIYFQQMFFAAYAISMAMVHALPIKSVCIAIDIMTLIALNPAFRFDGYWFLVDWLNVSNLRKVSRLYSRSIYTLWLGRNKKGNLIEPDHLYGMKAWTFRCYALFADLFIVLALALNLNSIRIIAHDAYTGIPVLLRQAVYAFRVLDFWGMVNSLITIWFIAGFVVMAAYGLVSRIRPHGLRKGRLISTSPRQGDTP